MSYAQKILTTNVIQDSIYPNLILKIKFGYTLRTSGAECLRANPLFAGLPDKLSVYMYTHLNLPKPLLHMMYARIKG
jgi:hypothetical protein